jgi:FkbH-like protein
MTSQTNGHPGPSQIEELNLLLQNRSELLLPKLRSNSEAAVSFKELILLSTLRKKAKRRGLFCPDPARNAIKVAVVGGSTLYPLSEFVEHMLEVTVGPVELMTGEYNNYRSEILDSDSYLYKFRPDCVVIIPEEKTCRYLGRLTDTADTIEEQADEVSSELLQLCATVKETSGAEVILCNFMPPPHFDLGTPRLKSLASDWNFTRLVNLSLSKKAAAYVHICDVEFLAYRQGALSAKDERAWFESKQLYSPFLQVSVAKEISHLIGSIRKTPKKVLVLDLDNTLWGGVIGDDGLQGIEIGDTSPRGEAFKAFQAYIRSLPERGILLGVCSKNDFDNAIEPFRSHPEMVLREDNFVSFKANWEPKAKNIVEMADELNLGLDSFIFVDDNPAEIEIVKQFAPEVTTILLGDDPSQYVRQLKESRLFERSALTSEDAARTRQYKEEADRKRLQSSCIDMSSYLESLEMRARISSFNAVDAPRIAQLINKSNQFNLTTRRRSESELQDVMADPTYCGFTVRLADRFGDHGLISIVILRVSGSGYLEIDTWLMSCRVLKRQVEDLVMNEIARAASGLGCKAVKGVYLPTAKNGMVRNLLPGFGFRLIDENQSRSDYQLDLADYQPRETFILVESKPVYDEQRSSSSLSTAAVHI